MFAIGPVLDRFERDGRPAVPHQREPGCFVDQSLIAFLVGVVPRR